MNPNKTNRVTLLLRIYCSHGKVTAATHPGTEWQAWRLPWSVPDGVGRLPAMGWNSWNEYGCNINENVFLTTAQKLVSTGLKDLGYVYVNVDDCWSDKSKKRDSKTNQIIPDATKFPKGISSTAAQIHALGLKMGIYSDAGLRRPCCISAI